MDFRVCFGFLWVILCGGVVGLRFLGIKGEYCEWVGMKGWLGFGDLGLMGF